MVPFRKGLGKIVESIKNIRSDAVDYSARKQFDRDLSKITSGSDEDRVTAIKSLVAQAKADSTLAEQVVDNLIFSLSSQPPDSQLATLDALLSLQKEATNRKQEIVKALKSTFSSPHPKVRVNTAQLWIKLSLSSPESLSKIMSKLFNLISDDDKEVRYGAADALKPVLVKQTKLSLPYLKKILANNDWRIRYHGITMAIFLVRKNPKVSKYISKEATESIVFHRSISEKATELVGIIGKINPHLVSDSFSHLKEGLHSNNPELCKSSAKAIGRIASNDADLVVSLIPDLASALESNSWWVHEQVLRTMGVIGAQRIDVIEPYLGLIENRVATGGEAEIRKAAKWALEKIGVH